MDLNDFFRYLQQMQQQTKHNSPTITFTIIKNNPEDRCFKDGMCNAYTQGMNKFGQLDLQIVLDIPDEEKKNIINWIGYEIVNNTIIVQNNVEVYKTVNGPYIRLNLVRNEKNEQLWRIVLPDPYGKMPEESNIEPYCLQMQSPFLYQ